MIPAAWLVCHVICRRLGEPSQTDSISPKCLFCNRSRRNTLNQHEIVSSHALWSTTDTNATWNHPIDHSVGESLDGLPTSQCVGTRRTWAAIIVSHRRGKWPRGDAKVRERERARDIFHLSECCSRELLKKKKKKKKLIDQAQNKVSPAGIEMCHFYGFAFFFGTPSACTPTDQKKPPEQSFTRLPTVDSPSSVHFYTKR